MKRAMTIVLVLIGVKCFAQNDSTIAEKMQFPRYAIGITPSAVINYYKGLQLSHDIRLDPNLNLCIETAYIPDFLDNNFNSDVAGFRLRTTLESFLNRGSSAALLIGVFINYRRVETLYDISETKATGQYVEHYRYKEITDYPGAGFSMSAMIYGDSRLTMKIGIGIGISKLFTKTIADKAIPEDVIDRDDFFLFDVRDNLAFTQLNINYRIF
jgi:hypothetical protein